MNNLILIPKIEKYIEYMLIILLKLPRTEKYSIGTEIINTIYACIEGRCMHKTSKNVRIAMKSAKVN